MLDLSKVGRNWLVDQVENMDDKIVRRKPVEFNEENRYLPDGVSPRPGFIRYDLFPFLREIIECFDPLSPVREVNLMKGVQTGYTTALESILFYYMVHIKTQAAMFLTAANAGPKLRAAWRIFATQARRTAGTYETDWRRCRRNLYRLDHHR